MPTFRVNILRDANVKTTVHNMGPISESLEITARDAYAAQGLVQAQYAPLYKVMSCTYLRD